MEISIEKIYTINIDSLAKLNMESFFLALF